jgi:hypothetical protein
MEVPVRIDLPPRAARSRSVCAGRLVTETDLRSAELWLRPDDGHVSVLNSAEAAMGWLLAHATRR